MVLVVLNVVYSAAAWPVGALSDRIGRRGLLISGFAVLALSHLVLACATGLVGVALGTMLWGLHMGLTQGLLAAEVATTAPADLRGTGFGTFNLVTGLALLAANTLAGALWVGAGPQAMFLMAALAAAAGTLAIWRRAPIRED
jgi:MFS family permease